MAKLKWCPLCRGKVEYHSRTKPFMDKDKRGRLISVIGEIWVCQNPICRDEEGNPTRVMLKYKTDEQMRLDRELYGEKNAMGDMFLEELEIKAGIRKRKITIIEGVND